ncbi:LamG-like jellyroll fold domain-containing protein [Cytobacillus purgationiresistens]|uniref:Uncharacterized protein n=1 Tax=Cytobacillus purgationiresistens TaxID=863449 RepID=A0ABU0AKF3_9BACI|nr:LamG-like jellyroll fold domain-containing protein [Cytobacillus purgationiresistens]MDQ0271252.1 hypothetical protein [Cytobacillus purgationiresistens]
MIKKVIFTLLCTILVINSIHVTNYVHADSFGKKTVLFPTSPSIHQSQTISIPNLVKVDSVTVDNGEVDFDVNGEDINIKVSNGEAIPIQTGGDYIPEETKYVTEQTSENYSHEGFTGKLNQYVYSGSYTPADTKFVTGQSSPNYNKDGYSGTLEGYVVSGQYSPSDTKYVSGEYSSYYNKDGYSGYLNSYVVSGYYTPSDSKNHSTSQYGSCTDGFQWWATNGGAGGWMDSRVGAWWNGSSSIYHNDGTYSGWLSQYHMTECDAPYPSYTGSIGDIAYTQGYATAYFSGTITRPAVDTREWRYEGNVTKPASDTRVWNYKGNVTKPAVDTRVYRYQGDVTKPAVDTRTYEDHYEYEVTIKYKDWVPNPNPITAEGLGLDGTSQYFQIKDADQYHLPINLTWGILFKPKSLTNQTIVSNGDISLSITEGLLQGVININGTKVKVDFDANYLFLDVWTFIGMTYDGSDVKLYFNEVLVDSKPAEGSVSYSGNNISVGGEKNFLYGDIKEFHIWDKALNGQEIAAASAKQYNSNGVGAWIFNNYTTSLSYDKSNFNNHANGKGFSPQTVIQSSDIDDLGINLSWDSIGNVTSYELLRNGTAIYEGPKNTFYDDALISDTEYAYTIIPKGADGISVAASGTFKTELGSLSILSNPVEVDMLPINLNGETQKSTGSFKEKIIIKDTRKDRNGWELKIYGMNFQSVDKTRSFPGGILKIKPIAGIKQIRGLKQALPSIVQSSQTVDNGPITVASGDSSITGYGIYEITLPDNALELSVNPAFAYVDSNRKTLDYSTSLNWSLIE